MPCDYMTWVVYLIDALWLYDLSCLPDRCPLIWWASVEVCPWGGSFRLAPACRQRTLPVGLYSCRSEITESINQPVVHHTVNTSYSEYSCRSEITESINQPVVHHTVNTSYSEYSCRSEITESINPACSTSYSEYIIQWIQLQVRDNRKY